LTYPAIARLARVSGVVLSRIIYSPSGKVLDVEQISGPPMLSSWTADQLKKWSVKTDATGDENCQELVITEFKMNDSRELPPTLIPHPEPPNILRLSVETELIPFETNTYDPAPLKGWQALRHDLGYKLKRLFGG
jgi:hypothetical protein